MKYIHKIYKIIKVAITALMKNSNNRNHSDVLVNSIPEFIINNIPNNRLQKLYQLIDTENLNQEAITALYNQIFKRKDDQYTITQLYASQKHVEDEILKRIREGKWSCEQD